MYELGQITSSLWGSVPSSVKWGTGTDRPLGVPSRSDLHVPAGVGSIYCLLVIFPYMKDIFYFTSQKETLLEEYFQLLVSQEVAT